MNSQKATSVGKWSVVFAIIPAAGVISFLLLLMIPVWSGRVSGEGGLGIMIGIGEILYFGSHVLLATSLVGMGLGILAIYRTGWQRGVAGLLLNLSVLVVSGAYLATVYHHQRMDPYNLPLAARQGDKKKVEKLLAAGFDIDYALGSATALSNAAANGHLEIVELLLAHGANIKIGNPVGAAAASGHEEIVKYLLDHGGSPDCMYAVIQGKNINIFRILLDHGANVNQRVDSSDRTPLQSTIEHKEEEMAKLLISRGADVNAKNSSGETPLHVLVQMWPENNWPKDFRKRAINMLLDAGADIEAKTQSGKTPLCLAAEAANSLDAVKALSERHANLANIKDVQVRFIAISPSMDKTELSEWVRANAGDIHVKNERGESLLHAAVKGANVNLAEILLTSGIDVNAKTNTGETPLHWAMRKFDPAMVELLVSHGTDVNARNNAGLTPLYLVASPVNRGDEKLLEAERRKVVEILLENGVQVNIANNEGRTPLDNLEHWLPATGAGICYISAYK